MQYAKDDSKITFDEFKDILKELDILSWQIHNFMLN
jgi:hypothetical protein